MNDWKKVKLSAILNIISGGTPKTNIPEYWNGGTPWLSISDFNNGLRHVERAEKTITELGLSNSSTTLLKIGDLIISARGTVGVVSQIAAPMAFNQSCYGLRANGKTTNDFLYYALKNLVKEIKQNVHGSVFDTITKDTFEILEIELPPLPEQKAIADVLSSLDDKIELNNKINKNLEEQAEALFKRWFVDFEFPDENGNPYKSSGGEMKESELGLIPTDWEVKSLDNIAYFLNGLAIQKYRPVNETFSYKVIKIRELNSGGFIKDSELCDIGIDKQYLIKDGDVVFSWSGTLLVKIWTGGIGGLNQHLFKVTSNNYKKWFYYFWLLYHLEEFKAIASDKATTMGHIKREHLSKAKVLVPEDLHVLDSKMQPVLEKIILNQIENHKLATIRDSILPKLMSGELRVNN